MLARFRVNPTQIRVAVRRRSDGNWTATLTHRHHACDDSGSVYWRIVATNPVVDVAVNDVLREAEARKWKGLDLDMQWSYEHPQCPVTGYLSTVGPKLPDKKEF